MGIVYALGPHVAWWVERVLRVYVGLTGALVLVVAAATLDLRLRPPRLLARRARPAAAPLRPAQPPQPPLARGRRRRRRDLDRPARRDGVHDEPRRLPREPLQLRRPARLHGGAARGRQAPLQQAGARAALPRAALGAGAGRATSRCRPSSAPSRRGDLRRRDGRRTSAPATAGRPGSRRRRRLSPRAPQPRHGPARARRAGRGARRCREAEFSKILVPMKLGEIGEEMVATAVKLAQERGAAVEALHVILVPLDQPLDAELVDEEERAAASLAEAAAARRRPRRRGRGPRRPRPLDRRGDRRRRRRRAEPT